METMDIVPQNGDFLLPNAKVECTSAREACCRCHIVVKGEHKWRAFNLPIAYIKPTPYGIEVPSWLIDKEQRKYRAMFGVTGLLVAEVIPH